MTLALYASIWLSLIGLLIGESGRHRSRHTRTVARWAIACSFGGVFLGALHTLLALGVAYDWDHARAVTATAERAATVYGIAWSGSVYVNYVFLAWWLIDTVWWWRAPASFIARPRVIEWCWRLTVFTMVINGAVIFASPAGRLAGVPLVAALVFIWSKALLPKLKSSEPSGSSPTGQPG